MKVLLLVLVLALAGSGAYYFHFRDHPVAWMQGPELASGTTPGGPGSAAPAGKKDFKELSARLQGAMDRIPVNLHEARQLPTYALDTRSKLAPYVQLHAEYATVTQVCDLIIDATRRSRTTRKNAVSSLRTRGPLLRSARAWPTARIPPTTRRGRRSGTTSDCKRTARFASCSPPWKIGDSKGSASRALASELL